MHDLYYFFNHDLNVFDPYIFDEILFIFVQNCIVKHVVDEEVDEFGGRGHFVTAWENVLQDVVHLRLEVLIGNLDNQSIQGCQKLDQRSYLS